MEGNHQDRPISVAEAYTNWLSHPNVDCNSIPGYSNRNRRPWNDEGTTATCNELNYRRLGAVGIEVPVAVFFVAVRQFNFL